MIVQCNVCNTNYRLDDSKVTAKGVKVRCTKCQNVFVVTPPPETVEPNQEEGFKISSESQHEPTPKTTEVDFSKFSGETSAPQQEEEKPKPPSWNLGGVDFTFEEKPGAEEKKSEWDLGFASTTPAKEDTSFSVEEKKEEPQPEVEKGGFGFGVGEEPVFREEERDTTPSQELTGFSFDEGVASADEKKSFEIEPSSPQIPTEEEIGKDFEETKDLSFEPPSQEKSTKSRAIIYMVIALLLVVGAGVVYLNRGTEFLGKTGSKVSLQKVMDIIDLKGYYINNTSLGRMFVIEGKVVSNINAPKEVTGIHGIVFDKSGKQIKDTWVAPGRIISQDELKNISMADLEKRFKDRKGTIPPKGTVPFTIVFEGITGELAEFSVEIDQ